MYQTEDILEGARSIRPYLSELLGENAEVTDRKLAELLSLTQKGENVDSVILELLSRHETTRVWMAKFLQLKRPPEPQVEKSYNPLPGTPSPVSARKFFCPRGDYVWYRRAAGASVPECPTHGIPLEPA